MPHLSGAPLQSVYRGRVSNQSQIRFISLVAVVMTKPQWVEKAEQCNARNTAIKK